jgi:hypothetical protein
VGYRDVIGEDRRESVVPAGRRFAALSSIEFDADDERRGLDVRRRDGQAGGLRLTARHRLQDGLDPAGIDDARLGL